MYLRYFLHLFLKEFVKGGTAGRRRFTNRIRTRLSLFRFSKNEEHLNWRINGSSPRIVVLGTGSIGDVLLTTPVIRALKERVPTARIAVLHSSAAVKTVLRDNDAIESATPLLLHQFPEIINAVENESAADVAIDVRYLVRYVRAKTTIIGMDESFFAKAAETLAPWRGLMEPFPGDVYRIAQKAEAHGMHVLDVLGLTANLPITHDSKLDFFIRKDDENILQSLPAGAPVITVNNGVDADVKDWMAATKRRATKMLPQNTFRRVVELLKARNFTVVQLGAADDEEIPAVSFDLRGKTTLHEAAAVLKAARCHVGIEGALAHLARAVETRAVVLFGPTPRSFLGYPQNINLQAPGCKPFWWSSRHWYIQAPGSADCMAAFSPEEIVEAALKIAHENRD